MTLNIYNFLLISWLFAHNTICEAILESQLNIFLCFWFVHFSILLIFWLKMLTGDHFELQDRDTAFTICSKSCMKRKNGMKCGSKSYLIKLYFFESPHKSHFYQSCKVRFSAKSFFLNSPSVVLTSIPSNFHWHPVLVNGGSVVQRAFSKGTKHLSSLLGQQYDVEGKWGCLNFTLTLPFSSSTFY